MPKTELTIKSYPALLSQLKKVFIDGLQKIEEEKVKVYWQTGKLISEFVVGHKERADYGDNLFLRLSEDLAIDRSTLQRTVQFYNAFPNCAAQHKLTWMHYRELITIDDENKRELFVERAVKKQWGYRELSEAIRLDKLKVEESKESVSIQLGVVKLAVTRSRLFTYQVLEPSYIHPVEEWLTIDLGFNTLIHKEIKGLRVRAGELIESIKIDTTSSNADNRESNADKRRLNLRPSVCNPRESALTSYSFKHSDASNKELYTYKALVERVVDGDTFWLNIDLGFSCWTRQKIRLRGIDTPELSTKKGVEAKQFVEARLKEVSFVVVKTYKDDKYGRYLTDIFYLKGEEDPHVVLEQGTFLNQELLDSELARIM